MNILLTTMGTTWAVVPELLAFTNPEQTPLLAAHPEAEDLARRRRDWEVEPVDEVWVAATLGKRVREASEQLWQWARSNEAAPAIREFTMEGVTELSSVEECIRMRELIFRLALRARSVTRAGGKRYLSLAGGRKTMSADMQLAAEHFGCDLLLHVVDDGQLPEHLGRYPAASSFCGQLPAEHAASLTPLIIRGPGRAREIFDLAEAEVSDERFPVSIMGRELRLSSSRALVDRVEAVMSQADYLMRNFTHQLVSRSEEANFHALYRLPPSVIEDLRSRRIGVDAAAVEDDSAWLRALPKAELHCHLGGVLDSGGHLRVAEAIRPEVEAKEACDRRFADWREKLRRHRNASVEEVREAFCRNGEWKAVRDDFGEDARHLATAALLLDGLGSEERVEAFVHGEWADETRFRGIGFDPYEKLGDLQGSSLLQSQAGIRAACEEVIKMCERENVIYCELRCSPMNCTLGGLGPEDVIRSLRKSLDERTATIFRLIFIASRHGKAERVQETVDLARRFRDAEGKAEFDSWFGGFDLAGAESARTPKEMREILRPVLEECLNITIHAGEDADPWNIWEAVYDLNADRIGHGLTLPRRPELLQRLRRKRVAIELCPSSNRQIVGYDFAGEEGNADEPYPLRAFLEAGLRVTVNTDDPGMSRTGLSNEYLQAARMSAGGLSRWETLHLVRNGFKAAFLPPEKRKCLILKAERCILDRLEAASDTV